jgi:GNAT superfamily N-acetyltransferase
MQIAVVTENDLSDLLALMRAYCDFYEVSPSDQALLAFSRLLLADPLRDGLQLIARSDDGDAIGYATLSWSVSTLATSRIGIMEDLFVSPAHRGQGLADRLIEECRSRARAHGATSLHWQTAPSNLRAQRVYERVGAVREQWIDYVLEI